MRFLITGVSTGLGKAVSENLLKRNCSVIGVGRNKPDFESAGFSFIKNDFEAFSPFEISGKLDGVILNSGVTVYKRVSQAKQEDFERVFKVNIFGNILTLKSILKNLRKDSVVVLISSVAALEENCFENWGLYSSSKVAAEKMLEIFSKEEGFKLLILNIGRVDTGLWEAVKGEESKLSRHSVTVIAEKIVEETLDMLKEKSVLPVRKTLG